MSTPTIFSYAPPRADSGEGIVLDDGTLEWTGSVHGPAYPDGWRAEPAGTARVHITPHGVVHVCSIAAQVDPALALAAAARWFADAWAEQLAKEVLGRQEARAA
jgi:hypothetical protein